MEDSFTVFEFIPACNSGDNTNWLIISPARIAINLDDTKTKKHFDDFKNFCSNSFQEYEPSNFFKFTKQISDGYYNHYSVVHKQQEDDEPQSVKINLDTSSLDAAIDKTDKLIAKLKTAQKLMYGKRKN